MNQPGAANGPVVERVFATIDAALRGESALAQVDERTFAELCDTTDHEVLVLLDGLLSLDLTACGRPQDALLASVLHALALRLRAESPADGFQLPGEIQQRLAWLFERLPAGGMARAYLLQILAMARDEDSLTLLAALWATASPPDARSAAVALGPLFQRQDYDPRPLFPTLFDTAAHPAAAATAIDLANFTVRQGLVDTHPATDRRTGLVRLLGELTQRLSVMEELPDRPGESARQLSEQVEDALALAVTLCDALALIGDREAIGKLYQAMDLSHRRLRTEAAAALARLGEEPGAKTLADMAGHPVTRLRVLAYAEELDLLDKIDPRHQTAEARAEAELALWLSQPSQLGIPPSRLERVDSRTLYWPGYDDPIECFLFRFTYQVGDAEYSNIAIVGPATHAFAADLADLSPDDIYAAFAGWQAEHEEVFEIPYEELNEPQRVEVARLERRLRDHGYDDIRPVMLGSFFGDRSLVARATHRGTPCVVVVDALDVLSFPVAAAASGRPRLGPAEVYAIYKGRKLLRSFNP